MKEATGSLNLTIVVVISIGILAFFFYSQLWPLIKGNMDRNSKCSQAICDNGDANSDGLVRCHYGDIELQCQWKG